MIKDRILELNEQQFSVILHAMTNLMIDIDAGPKTLTGYTDPVMRIIKLGAIAAVLVIDERTGQFTQLKDNLFRMTEGIMNQPNI